MTHSAYFDAQDGGLRIVSAEPFEGQPRLSAWWITNDRFVMLSRDDAARLRDMLDTWLEENPAPVRGLVALRALIDETDPEGHGVLCAKLIRIADEIEEDASK